VTEDLQERVRTSLADRYAIEREIGRGGMATVYLAQDLKHHRPVAVKLLHPHLAANLGPDRFLREIQIAARLQHPHIVPLYDSGQAGDLLYYVMPYVSGCASGSSGRRSCRSRKPRDWRGRSRSRWTTPTASRSCTATSSPRTS
jgi:serine/threonine protein kinase